MKQLTAQQKHDILVHCQTRRAGQTEMAVAALYGASVTARTIWNWRRRWNGTPRSLEHKPGAGRPRMLTPAEVSRHVRAPVLAANRAHRVVSYTTLLPSVREKTGKPVSVQTLRRVGKKQLEIKSKTTRKRTREERQCTHACGSARTHLVDEQHADLNDSLG